MVIVHEHIIQKRDIYTIYIYIYIYMCVCVCVCVCVCIHGFFIDYINTTKCIQKGFFTK